MDIYENMKILNGKYYYERKDVYLNYTKSCSIIDNPRNIKSILRKNLDFDLDFLYNINSDDQLTLKDGITKLNNTISWEFSTESAVNYKKIEECYLSLKTPASNLLSIHEFKRHSPSSLTTDLLISYENWLGEMGMSIFFSLFN